MQNTRSVVNLSSCIRPGRVQGRVGRRIKKRIGQCCASFSVEQGMMNLKVIRFLATGQTFKHIQHPKWQTAVEQLRMQVGHHRLQLQPAARRRDADAFNMPAQVNFTLQPNGVGKVQWHAGEPAPQDRDHASLQHGKYCCNKIPLIVRCGLKHMQRAHVHRSFKGFKVQKDAIQTAEWLHTRHRFCHSCLSIIGVSQLS